MTFLASIREGGFMEKTSGNNDELQASIRVNFSFKNLYREFLVRIKNINGIPTFIVTVKTAHKLIYLNYE